MSLFGRFTGTKKSVEQKEQTPFDSSRLTNHASDLDKKEGEINRKIQEIDREIGQIKEQMKNRGPNYKYLHDKAISLLRKRKIYENQMRSYSNMNISINQTITTLDSIQMMQEQYNIMKEVTSAQNAMFKSVNIEDYMALSDQMQEMREDMDDVQEMLADAMVGDIDMDEEELDRELAMYATESMPLPGSSVIDAPTTQPATAMPSLPEYNLNDDLSRL